MAFSLGCTKNPVPAPPVHDTVTIVRHDTTIKKDTTKLTDTVYATRSDSTVNLTKGLLLYLNFTGNIADSSGNNNPTTAVGSVLTYDAHGYTNSAFGSSGNGNKVYVTNNGSIQFDTAYSISFAFMVNDNRAAAYLSMVDPVSGKGPSFLIGNTLAGVPSVVMGTEDVTLGCSAYGTNDNLNAVDTTGFTPVPGAWYNAIGIYHKGLIQFYVNGKLMATKMGMGTRSNLCPGSQIIIGDWWNGNPPNNSLNISGKLDNVRLYNRVLTAHEITLLSKYYQITSNSQQPPLRSH